MGYDPQVASSIAGRDSLRRAGHAVGFFRFLLAVLEEDSARVDGFDVGAHGAWARPGQDPASETSLASVSLSCRQRQQRRALRANLRNGSVPNNSLLIRRQAALL